MDYEKNIHRILNRVPEKYRPIVRAEIELLILLVDRDTYQSTYTEIIETMRKAGK